VKVPVRSRELEAGERILAGSAVRWGLEPARLAPPAPRPADVPRAAVLALLSDPAPRVFSVVAPSGYGKTRAIADHVRRAGRPTLWLTIGDDCGDPIVLARYLAMGLERWGPIDIALERQLNAVHPRDAVLAAGMCAAVAAAPDGLLIVVDDVQLLSAEGVTLIQRIVENAPPGAQAVLCGTRAVPFVGRKRAAGEVLEIGARDLEFDADEALLLLRGAGAVDIDPLDAASLRDRTEGWAAGLYLAALALRDGGRDVERLPETFQGSHRFVVDFLREAVLERLSQDQVDFLTRTAILEELSGPLCDAVLEIGDSAARLEELDAKNLFVVPLDDRRERYRYHRLFRDCLVSELSHHAPELVPALHARASRWYEDRGSPDRAIAHAIAGGDVDRLATLLRRHAQTLYFTGRGEALVGWFEWFSEHARLEAHPEVAVSAMWLMILWGRPVALERWAAAAEPDAAGHALEPLEEAARILAEAARCRRGIDAMVRDAEAARSMLPPGSPFQATAWILLGLASVMRGDLDGSVEQLQTAVKYAEELENHAAAASACGELAMIALRQSDLAGAAAHTARACQAIEAGGLEGYPTNALSLASAAHIAVLEGDRERATRLLAEARATGSRLTVAIPVLALQSRLALARCAIGLGDVRAAQASLDEANELVAARPALGVLIDQLREIEAELHALAASGLAITPLTPAEVRLLPLLTTHLSFREIGELLFISRHTVKTHAISIYRKLGVTSRAGAVQAARRLGVLGS
jgi:LuxR family transcriptional regulator, maltose regulon positive regulatory protein